jgi:hypothetical protein
LQWRFSIPYSYFQGRGRWSVAVFNLSQLLAGELMSSELVYAVRRVSFIGEGNTTMYLFRNKEDAKQKIRELRITWMEYLNEDWDFDISEMELW